MIKKFSSPKMRNRQSFDTLRIVLSAVGGQFVFAPKIEYELVAESFDFSQDKLREANQNSLTFPDWCPQEESNLHSSFRKAVLCPLSYGGQLTLN